MEKDHSERSHSKEDTSVVSLAFNKQLDTIIDKISDKLKSSLTTSNLLEPLLNKDEAAAYLNIKPCTLSAWVTQGRAPTYSKLGSRIVFRREWLDEFVETNRIRQ